ncbi:MAG: hypothetical protein A2542_00810 [Parcubacteria group bacterium RIFOXYD2_FULL_52_8]|nr:MAG: hypothetical protein A2542_00810 [Parcubacteria group bacterium RIFOXYD2_FULL_52_8]
MQTSAIKEFRDLIAWQKSHELTVMLYKKTTKFPKEEIYGITNQMRRAAVSVTSNIAEGFGRRGNKERLQFYYLAQGSLTELKNQIITSFDVGYLPAGDYNELMSQADLAHKVLQGLMLKTKSFLALTS